MSTITMTPTSIYSSYPLYDENNLQQECEMPTFSQSVDFDALTYSTAFPVTYSAALQQPAPPLSIYTTNLENFSNSSLSSAATSTSSYYPELSFAPCNVDNSQWTTHIDDGYVSGDTSPISQAIPHDAFYPISDQQHVLLMDSTLGGLDMGAPIEPTSLLGEPASMAPQYTMFDTTANSSDMNGLSMDPMNASNDVYVPSSPESSPSLSAARSKSVGSRSPSPTQQQSYYSTFDNKGALMKCPHKGCTKAFGRIYNLKTHLKSHVSTKPWECPMCPRSFTRKHDLQRHVRVHTGQKPYVCPCCHKRFARTDALTRHIRVEDSCRLSEEVANYKGRRRYSDLS